MRKFKLVNSEFFAKVHIGELRFVMEDSEAKRLLKTIGVDLKRGLRLVADLRSSHRRTPSN